MAWGRAQRVLLARALSTLPSPGPDGTAIQGLEGEPRPKRPLMWRPRAVDPEGHMRYTYLFSTQLLPSTCEN